MRLLGKLEFACASSQVGKTKSESGNEGQAWKFTHAYRTLHVGNRFHIWSAPELAPPLVLPELGQICHGQVAQGVVFSPISYLAAPRRV